MSDITEEVIASKVEEEMRRKDDSFLRKLAIGVVGAVMVQLVASIYFAGTLSNQVGNNTVAIESLARKLETQEAVALAQEKLKALVEIMTLSVSKLEAKLELVAEEQKKRTSIIERTESHLQRFKN